MHERYVSIGESVEVLCVVLFVAFCIWLFIVIRDVDVDFVVFIENWILTPICIVLFTGVYVCARLWFFIRRKRWEGITFAELMTE